MIYINHDDYSRVIAKGVNSVFNPYADQSIVRVEDGVVLGGALFNNYLRYSICIHVAAFAPNWINKSLLWICADYPFNQLGVRNIFAQVPGKNITSLEFCYRFGFTEVVRIDGVIEDDQYVVLCLAKEHCRWLKMKRPKLDIG